MRSTVPLTQKPLQQPVCHRDVVTSHENTKSTRHKQAGKGPGLTGARSAPRAGQDSRFHMDLRMLPLSQDKAL